jgi:hypothetical protein
VTPDQLLLVAGLLAAVGLVTAWLVLRAVLGGY